MMVLVHQRGAAFVLLGLFQNAFPLNVPAIPPSSHVLLLSFPLTWARSLDC